MYFSLDPSDGIYTLIRLYLSPCKHKFVTDILSLMYVNLRRSRKLVSYTIAEPADLRPRFFLVAFVIKVANFFIDFSLVMSSLLNDFCHVSWIISIVVLPAISMRYSSLFSAPLMLIVAILMQCWLCFSCQCVWSLWVLTRADALLCESVVSLMELAAEDSSDVNVAVLSLLLILCPLSILIEFI